VSHFILMKQQEHMISRTLNRRLKSSSTTLPVPPSNFQAHTIPSAVPPASSSPADDISAITGFTRAPVLLSPAEATMNKYQPASAISEYPIDPLTNFQSPHGVMQGVRYMLASSTIRDYFLYKAVKELLLVG
jgi:hypothetical protein